MQTQPYTPAILMPPAESSDETRWATEIAAAAVKLGFERVGFAPAQRFERGARALSDWLAAGLHGEMSYLAGGSDRAAPQALLAEAKTVVVVALAYAGSGLVALRKPGTATDTSGYIASYARGPDYHSVMREKLSALLEACSAIIGRPVLGRPCSDTAPLLEREAAWFAGVGFMGKNTLSIAPGLGSNFLLGEVLLDVELPQSPSEPQGCGRCRACLDACPTQAFQSEYVLDARRCISYLTIEYRGVIPTELRPLMGNHVFGCDICQTVCPYNARAEAKPHSPALAPSAKLEAPELIGLLELTSSGYRRLVQGTALRRVSRSRLARNAAIALGNSRDPSAWAPLARALLHHSHALVRGHAAWAMGELAVSLKLEAARQPLEEALRLEHDATVQVEIRAALDRLDRAAPEQSEPGGVPSAAKRATFRQ